MRGATIATLKALNESKEVTAGNSLKFGTTRITNEITKLRNELGIDIITDRVETKNSKWYGSYRLNRTTENLEKVRVILEHYSKQDEV